MVMPPLMRTLYYSKQRLQRLAEDASPVAAGGSINHATLSRAMASDSYSSLSGQGVAAALPVLSQCEKAFSRSERKEKLRARGYESRASGTDFAYAVEANNCICQTTQDEG